MIKTEHISPVCQAKHQPKREKEGSSVETQESVTYVTASEAQDDLELALF